MNFIIHTLYTVFWFALLARCQEGADKELAISCDDETVKCYSLFKKTVTWDGAVALCQSMNRHLAIINNECSQRLIANFKYDFTKFEAAHAWTALRRNKDNTWRNLVGQLFPEHINGSQDGNASCVIMQIDGDEQPHFVAKKCYEKVPRAALCQYPATTEECPNDYHEGKYCYHIHNRLFWSLNDAKQFCSSLRPNGTLGYSNLTSSRLLKHFAEINTVMWVGIERRPWMWFRDGKQIRPTYLSWRQYEGSNWREDCMHAELKVQSKWSDKNCSMTSDYVICETGTGPEKTPFSFNDMFNGFYWPRGYYAFFHEQYDVFIYRDDDGHVVGRDLGAGIVFPIMDAHFLFNLDAYTYFVSDDLSYVLIAYERTKLYRNSFTAKYKVFDRQNNVVLDFPNMAGIQNSRLQYAGWSKGSNKLAFVYNNDLYYQPSPNGSAIQVTTDGVENYIYNGVPDWMFEEDVLWSNKATYWSAGGARLCFARFDVTGIPKETITVFGNDDDMYPDVMEYVVPKAGHMENGQLGKTTKVDLFIFDTNSPGDSAKRLPPPDELSNQDYYYTSVEWINDDTVYVTWTNRAMNRSVTTICDAVQLKCFTNHDLIVPNGWVRIPAVKPWFIDDGSYYVTILPKNVTGYGTWRHLAFVTANKGEAAVTFLTDGPQEITDIVGYDPVLRCIYYRTTNGDPAERHIFRVGTPFASSRNIDRECMTCSPNSKCSYHSATFSSTGTFYKLVCLGPVVPEHKLLSTRDSKWGEVLEDNAFVKSKLAEKRLPGPEYMDLPLPDGTVLKAVVYIPPSFLPGKSYRMLYYVYGAPDSQEVTNIHPLGTYGTAWFTYLSSTHDVIIVTADGRGTYGRGDDWRFAVYKHLGRRDVTDHVEAAKYLKNHNMINTTANAAVIGWSYGGMMASLALASDPEAFQCGLAISAITSKRFYNRAYSERYLGFANESTEAYDGTDVMKKAANFKGKKFFIAHGTKDDNVQIRHMAALEKELRKQGIMYKQRTYFDENHDLSSYYTTQHLYRAMTDFLLNDCWGQ